MRDAGGGETEESEDVVRECKSWTGWNQVKEQAWKINQGDWRKKPKLGVKRKGWDVRQDFANNEAVMGRCSFGFDEEGHRVELELDAVERVKLEEEHR